MNELITLVSTGLTAFTATNLDDILILMLFFSQVNAVFQKKHIVTGQYLGFAALVMASLPGFFGSLLLPRPCIGLLGLVPIAIGISRLMPANAEAEAESTAAPTPPTGFSSLISPQAYSVAAVTFANGGDNIGIYMPLFAHCTWPELALIVGVFFSLVAVWCFAADRLTQVPAIAETLTRYGGQLVPFVLVGLGVLILMDSHTLEDRGLAVLTLMISGCWVIALVRQIIERSATILPQPETLSHPR
jgi:cadmium resistance transport/sequestration family protein